jgi:predicted transcriptional regulator
MEVPERRSKFSIYTDILRFIFSNQNRARPTHIMYKANLSHKSMKNYLNEMMNEKLVEKKVIDGKTFFVLGERGKQFLMEYKKVKEFSEAFGIEI